MSTIDDMKSLNNKLKAAANAYYNENIEIMSNKEYDELYDRLLDMEKELGVTLSDSVTVQVGFETVSKLVKEKHEEKALSLDKTKSRDELDTWLGDNVGCMSFKLDGLTTVLTYDDGELTKAVTRGNGEIGEIVTHNARHIDGIPKRIKSKEHFVVRGETLMTYDNFEKINATLSPEDKYKNPRNLASGTLRALDSNVAAARKLNFMAFEFVTEGNKLPVNSFFESLEYLRDQGFDVVEHILVQPHKVHEAIEYFENKLDSNNFPSDGLVLQIDNIEYGKSLGTTGKFPKSGKAFKWQDETAETIIRDIVWQAGRTGSISPVAVFDPVELEGTTVSRATANNISFMEQHELSVGSKILVYKANMIIPTIDSNIKPNGPIVIPDKCPACGGPAIIKKTKDSKILFCTNDDCAAKNIKHFVHFVSRDAMNIIGLSENTIMKLIDNNIVHTYSDLYRLTQHPEIASLEGFGIESYNNLISAVNNSRDTTLGSFIYAFGIDMVGKSVANDIAAHFGSITAFTDALNSEFDFTTIDGIGNITNANIHKWYEIEANKSVYNELLTILHFIETSKPAESTISGQTFCITGTVEIFKNRNELADFIETNGGKLTNSVTAKTNYLVTNDPLSGSSKNKKAKELGTIIITEKELIRLVNGDN